MTDIDKRILSMIQDDIPLSLTPYKEIAEKAGITEKHLIRKIKYFRDKGYIRRFGATLRHREAGIEANGMSVWIVPEKDIERVGRIMASFKEVTHCYQRPTFPDWEYSLFTMIHGKTKEDVEDVARRISERTGIKDYRILYSTREFKKTSMKYFGWMDF